MCYPYTSLGSVLSPTLNTLNHPSSYTFFARLGLMVEAAR
jgi:hypothetical protein